MSIPFSSLERSDNHYKGYYLLTIQCCQKLKYVTEDKLDEVLLWLECSLNKFKVLYHVYEAHGTYNQMHLHAIVYYGGRYGQWTTYGDKEYSDMIFKINWKPIYCFRGSYAYLNKYNKFERSQQSDINYYTHVYGFTDTVKA